MYTIVVTNRAAKEIRKRGKPFKQKLTPIITLLENNPSSLDAERLTGVLNVVYSHHFSFSGSSYRIAYVIDEAIKTVTIILVAPRENFYQKLQRMLS